MSGSDYTPDRQPKPRVRPGAGDVQTQVAEDALKRREVGIQRYGTALQPFNERDALKDIYEELHDALAYVKQRMLEIEHVADMLHTLEAHGGRVTLECVPVAGHARWNAHYVRHGPDPGDSGGEHPLPLQRQQEVTWEFGDTPGAALDALALTREDWSKPPEPPDPPERSEDER